MTNEEIDAMPAGPEIDALVATEAMGWIVYRNQCSATGAYPYRSIADPQIYDSFCPSRKIENAWEVVEKLKGRAFISVVQRTEFQAAGLCGCHIDGWDGDETVHIEADADTAPLAICRAVLKARNV